MHFFSTQWDTHFPQQECIPVGCVPTAAVAATRCQNCRSGRVDGAYFQGMSAYYFCLLLGALITHPGMEHTAQDRPWDQRQEVTSTPLLWTEWQTLAKTLPSLATIIALGSKVSDRLRRITNNPRDLDNVLLFQAGWTQRYAYHCKHVGASLNPQYQESREMVLEKGTPWSHADSI